MPPANVVVTFPKRD